MHYFYDLIIDFDAHTAHESKDIKNLIFQAQKTLAENKAAELVIVLRNAHYLTVEAFAALNDYIHNSQDTTGLIVISSDKLKIFPPLLEYLNK